MRAHKDLIVKSYMHMSFYTPNYPYLRLPNFLSIQAQLSNCLSLRTSKNTNTYAFKPIDISGSTCVLMCVDIKHVNINACEHAIIKAFERRSR